MFELQIDVSGVTRAARVLDEMADAIEVEMDAFLVEMGGRFEGTAIAGAPRASGRLARGIEADLDVRVDDEGNRFVTVVADEFYAGFQERGARHWLTGQRIGGRGFFEMARTDVERAIKGELEARIAQVVASFGA